MTTKKFEARYTVADGYVGKGRPQHFMILASDLEDDMDDEALAKFYEESVSDDFSQNITPQSDRLDEFIVWAKHCLADRATRGE